MKMAQRTQSAGLAHRPEIDGIRAIAVMSVILFHFQIPGFTGGFVGVDIFFVISGFLIGSILWNEYERTGTISLVRFYVRRFRRLAPAYFVVAFATLVVGIWVMLPLEFYEFSKSLVAATVYLSNIHFYRKTGYFEAAAEERFMLHTWSLAVEEQFYVFLPLLLLLIGRFRRSRIAVIWLVAVVSLIACVWTTYRDHAAAFYLFPFRAWELLAGVLMAIHAVRTEKAIWSWAGLGLVITSLLLIPSGQDFPGVLVIPPVLGTVLLIMNGQQDNPVNRLLSSRPFVFVGLLSYSLYLWHWPVWTLSVYGRGEYEGVAELVGWFGLVFVLSWLSWKFVEQPFRKGQVTRPMTVFVPVAICSGLLVAAGMGIYMKNGLPDRFNAGERVHIDASQDFLQDFSRCFTTDAGPLAGIEQCPIGPEGRTPRLPDLGGLASARREGGDRSRRPRGGSPGPADLARRLPALLRRYEGGESSDRAGG